MPLALAAGTLEAMDRFARLRRRVPPPPRPTRGEVLLIVRTIGAGTLAWWLATLAGEPRPLFAVLVPLVAMGGDPFAAVNVSVTRTLGVFAGVLLGIGLLELSLPSTVLVAVLLALSLAAGVLLRIPGGAVNNQVAITAMFMLYLGVQQRAQSVGVARIWETALGAGVAVLVAAFVWPPDPLAEAKRRRERLDTWLCADLDVTARLVEQPDSLAARRHLELVRGRSREVVRDLYALERGERALAWNPLHRRDRPAFAEERRRFAAGARQYRHGRTLARYAADLAAEASLPQAERAALAASLRLLAHGHAVLPPALHDPRALAVDGKLRQLAADLAV